MKGWLAARIECRHIRHFDLEVDAAAIWLLKRCRVPTVPLTEGLLHHQIDAIAFDIGKTVFRPLLAGAKAEEIDVKGQCAFEIVDVEFGDEFYLHVCNPSSQSKAAVAVLRLAGKSARVLRKCFESHALGAEIMSLRLGSPMRLRLVSVLAVTQVIGWGTTFDMPGVMARKMASDVGLSIDTTFFGLTLMMLVIGLTGPAVGEAVRRMGAARVLVLGSATSTAGLALLAAAEGPIGYFVAWTMIGAAGSLALSVPAYAAAVEREGAAGRRTIGVLMIFTGVSSTIFWPILDAIDAVVGWRMTLFAMAGLHLLVCLPLHLFALPPISSQLVEPDATQRPLVALERDGAARAFLHIGVISVAFSFTTFGLAAAYLELLRGAGASVEYALWLGTIRPVVSIAARAADLVLDGRGGPLATTAAAALLMGGSFALLLSGTEGEWLLPAFVTIYAFGAGLSAMARAVLPLAFFPPDEFSRQSGRLALPQNIANAVAPVIFVAMIHQAGVASAAFLGLALMAAALASAALLAKLAHSSLPPSARTNTP